MIIWLNGTFGAGKTTASKKLVELLPEGRLFDSETVGYMLRHVLNTVRVKDFQDWPPWRGLVVEAASQILEFVGGVLVIPQTVLVQQYWDEIHAGLTKAGIPVHHFVLHTDPDTLVQRIEHDTIETVARQWRLDHVPLYQDALPWLRREAEVIDTTHLSPEQIAQRIADSVSS